MRFTFFYGQQIYLQTNDWGEMNRIMRDGPEGLWLFDRLGNGVWYFKGSGHQPDANVPPYLKVLQLVLSL